MNGSRWGLSCGLTLIAAAIASATAAAQGGSFAIANTNQSEVSVSVAYDGTNFLVGVQGDASDNSMVLARFVSPSGTVGPTVTTGRTGGVPFLAFSGTRYLMVWEDDITSPDDHIYGMLIETNGMHGAPFPISQKPANEHPAGVAYAGGQFLVAYSQGKGLYARQVSPTGVVGPELTITSGTFYEVDMNNVASNGSNYLVAWTDDANRYEVKARFVRLDGTLDPEFTVNASTQASDDPLAVSSDGTNYLVVWADEMVAPSGDEWDLFGQLVSPSGTLVGGVIPVSTAPGRQFGPFVATSGPRFLVTWTDLANDANGNWQCDPGEDTCWDIAGRHFLASGAPLGQEWPIVAAPDDQYASPVAFGAGKYLLVYTDGDWIAEGGDVYGLFLPYDPLASTYCTAKINSQGCSPSVSFSGVPSATSSDPFLITAFEVINNKNGILFYGKSGPASIPFSGGTLCVQPPVLRTPLLWSGGNPPPDDCSGVFSFDFNAYIQSGADPQLVPGVQVNGQFWYRDPASPTATGLTDAIQFYIAD